MYLLNDKTLKISDYKAQNLTTNLGGKFGCSIMHYKSGENDLKFVENPKIIKNLYISSR